MTAFSFPCHAHVWTWWSLFDLFVAGARELCALDVQIPYCVAGAAFKPPCANVAAGAAIAEPEPLIFALASVLSYVCSHAPHTCFHMCALMYLLTYGCSHICALSCVTFARSRTFVLLYVCCHTRALPCLLSHVFTDIRLFSITIHTMTDFMINQSIFAHR